ncbi:hypothetical protein BJ508DRAFT_331760 [Ascobolus immersus RN42]|uniref:Uncharacterized protein n=1 Tax=Ascobolus immersus RN42 TaxID=1160509 RepID=A0A3N4HRB5_ASCIM|nr:hypothetical protein BJ508DRAFT_331760 [Ascobolus immersus RN42]
MSDQQASKSSRTRSAPLQEDAEKENRNPGNVGLSTAKEEEKFAFGMELKDTGLTYAERFPASTPARTAVHKVQQGFRKRLLSGIGLDIDTSPVSGSERVDEGVFEVVRSRGTIGDIGRDVLVSYEPDDPSTSFFQEKYKQERNLQELMLEQIAENKKAIAALTSTVASLTSKTSELELRLEIEEDEKTEMRKELAKLLQDVKDLTLDKDQKGRVIASLRCELDNLRALDTHKELQAAKRTISRLEEEVAELKVEGEKSAAYRNRMVPVHNSLRNRGLVDYARDAIAKKVGGGKYKSWNDLLEDKGRSAAVNAMKRAMDTEVVEGWDGSNDEFVNFVVARTTAAREKGNCAAHNFSRKEVLKAVSMDTSADRPKLQVVAQFVDREDAWWEGTGEDALLEEIEEGGEFFD